MPRTRRPRTIQALRRKARKARPPVATKALTKVVKSIIAKRQELKVSRPLSTAANLEVQGGISLTNGNVLPIFPTIPQGTEEFQRIGNEIILKKLVVMAYYKQAFPITVNNQSRAMVRHMIVRQRNSESADSVINTAGVFLNNAILENASSYAGSIPNYNTPLNREAFVSRRQMKRIMSAPVSTSGTIQTTGSIDESYWMLKYTLTFGQGKKLHFRNGGATSPANFPYFLMHSAAALGSNTVLPVDAVVYNMTTTAYYTDA